MHFSYFHMVLLIVVPLILLASWIDIKERRVPNWLNATLGLLGLVAQFMYWGWQGETEFFGAVGFKAGLLGWLLGLGVLIVPWAMGAMGAGDVKLMAGIGAWLGPQVTLMSFVVGVILGGVIAIVMICRAGRVAAALGNFQTIMTKCTTPKLFFSEFGAAKKLSTVQLLPYGVPLTIGTLFVLAYGAISPLWSG